MTKIQAVAEIVGMSALPVLGAVLLQVELGYWESGEMQRVLTVTDALVEVDTLDVAFKNRPEFGAIANKPFFCNQDF